MITNQRSSLEQFLHRFDMFHIIKFSGMKIGFLFYLLGCLGTLFMMLSTIFFLYDGFNGDNQLFLKTLMKFKTSDPYSISPDMLVSNSRNKKDKYSLDLVKELATYNNYQYEAKSYKLAISLNQNALFITNDYCLSFENFESNKKECQNDGIVVARVKQEELTFQEMEQIGYCKGNCQQFCQQHKYLQLGQNCVIRMYLQNVCLIFENNTILDGCYKNGEHSHYELQQQANFEVQLVHKDDPQLLLKQEKIQFQERFVVFYLIMFGGIFLIGCVIIIMINEAKKRQNISDLQDVEMQEMVLTQQQLNNNDPQNQPIPLNY